jgi:hypothetical protein
MEHADKTGAAHEIWKMSRERYPSVARILLYVGECVVK